MSVRVPGGFNPASVAITGGNTPFILAFCAVPMVVAPTGSMANNGAITLGTALGLTYPNCFLNLPASAISAGSAAGWYYCQMSSTTVGTVFNNTFSGTVAANGIIPVPSSPVAFATTGPGAYTGVTTAQTINVTVPASIGANAELVVWTREKHNNSVGTKTLAIKHGSTAYNSLALSTSNETQFCTTIANAGVTNKQGGGAWGFVDSSATGQTAEIQGTVDTTATSTLAISLQLGTATDYQALTRLRVELYAPGV